MSNETERMRILEMIEGGTITPAEGLALLDALNGAAPSLPETAPDEVASEDEDSLPPPAPVETAISGSEWHSELPLPPVSGEPAAPVDGPAFQAPAHGAAAFEQELPPERESGEPATRGEVISPPTIGPDFSRWRRFWQIPLWVGVGVTIVSGILMFLAWQGSGFGFWFACSWLPFLLGVAVMALAWSTRNLPWLHIRIAQKPGERPQHITISLPLPLGVISWALRTFKHKIPGTGEVNLEEMVMALKHVSPDAPFSVDVEEGKDGERVQIYIG
jgi:hypothetical protein